MRSHYPSVKQPDCIVIVYCDVVDYLVCTCSSTRLRAELGKVEDEIFQRRRQNEQEFRRRQKQKKRRSMVTYAMSLIRVYVYVHVRVCNKVIASGVLS